MTNHFISKMQNNSQKYKENNQYTTNELSQTVASVLFPYNWIIILSISSLIMTTFNNLVINNIELLLIWLFIDLWTALYNLYLFNEIHELINLNTIIKQSNMTKHSKQTKKDR